MKRSIILLVFSLMMAVPYTIQSQNILAQESFTYDGITELRVEGSFCTVEVIGKNTDEVQFDGEITGKGGEIEIRHERNGSSLKVWVEKTGRWKGWSNTKGNLNFTVPSSIQLKIDNSSGRVYAKNISSSDCHLEASSGRVEAKDITATKTTLRTSSGRIEADGIEGNLESRTSSGGQHLRNVTGDIRSVSSSGRINIGNTRGYVQLESSSGGIHGENVLLTSDSRFKSTSGSIKIQLANNLDDIGFDCRASSGKIYVGESRRGNKYYNNQGDIMISGVSSSGGQKYY